MNELMVQKNGQARQVAAPQSAISYTPRFDVWENETEYVLAGDLPGVAPQDLDLHYENRELIVQARVAPRQTKGQPLHQEYGVGDFYRSFTVSDDVDEATIAADLQGGVLTVHLPKRAEARRRRIEVKAA